MFGTTGPPHVWYNWAPEWFEKSLEGFQKGFTKVWAVWEDFEGFGIVLEGLGSFGRSWDSLGGFRKVWKGLGWCRRFRLVWQGVGGFGKVWEGLKSVGRL